MLQFSVLLVFAAISHYTGDAAILNAPPTHRLSQHEKDDSYKTAYDKAVMEYPELKYQAREAEYVNTYDKDDIFVTFYSKSSPHGHKVDVDLVETVKNSSYDVKKMTKIIVGAVENQFNTSEMVTAYLRHYKENVNVITVHYRKFFGSEYTHYVQIYDLVTETIAKLIEQVHRYGALLDHVHVIGYGMSSHIAGGAAKLLHPYKVGRITGLDPTGGVFDQHQWLGQLSATDADFVDVITTNARKYGTKKERGTVHFYPHGGEIQPDNDDMTSHQKALAYFIESIVSTRTFSAEDANSWSDYKAGHTLGHTTYMGEYVSKYARGKYYLDVNPTSPYSKSGKYDSLLKDQVTYHPSRLFQMATQRTLPRGEQAFSQENLSREVNVFDAEDARTDRRSASHIYSYVRQKSSN